MLSGATQQYHPPQRPRPPRSGNGARGYLKTRDTNILPPSSPTPTHSFDEKLAFSPRPEPLVACHALEAAIQLDGDLDLDLPPGLTQALSQSTDRWNASSPSLEPPQSVQGLQRATSPDAYDGPKWRRDSRSPMSLTRGPTTPTTDDHPTQLRSSTSPLRTSPIRNMAASRRASQADMLTETLQAVAARPQDQVDEDEELDRAWLGGLPREELEALLFQANAVIQERERDLGIAAAIGQALLQKNTSLRRKHQEVMHRFHTSLDEQGPSPDHLQDDAQGDECPDTTDPPMYSPPSNETQAIRHDGLTPTTDDTPMPTPRMPSDYFQYTGSSSNSNLPSSPSASSTLSRKDVASSPISPGNSSTFASFAHMVPSTSGLISSTPQSPGGSTVYSENPLSPGASHGRNHNRLRPSIQASATHKQLSALSAQNEDLLARVAELQEEAEEAKREGSRRLRKLNREIKGLQVELDSVTERNTELESTKTTQKTWRSKQTPADLKDSNSASSQHTFDRQSLPSTTKRTATLHLSTSSESLSSGLYAMLHESPASQGANAEERSLVARLLSKVQELEQTNATLEAARKDRDGRLGAALKQGVQITDEYDAVLHAHESEMSLSLAGTEDGADGGRDGIQTFPSESSLGSPASQREGRAKRAIGNRWQVETRRTVRRALRRHRTAQEIWGSPTEDSDVQGLPASATDSSISSILNSSTSTSPFSSPRKPRRQRSALSLNRPRILITPSMEDLAARRKEQAEGWVDHNDKDEAATPIGGGSPSLQVKSLSLEDAHAIVRRASDEALRAKREKQVSEERQKMSSPLRAPGGSPSWPSHATARTPRRRMSSASQSFQSGTQHSTNVLLSSLGSELGSVLGDDETDAEQRCNTTNTSLLRLYYEDASVTSPSGDASSSHSSFRGSTTPRALKHSISCESLAVSDIANLHYDDPYRRESVSIRENAQSLLLNRQSSVEPQSLDYQLADRVLSPEGDWFYSAIAKKNVDARLQSLPELTEEHILPSGALRDRKEPREEQYSLLERVVDDQPVKWADDDDYGRPLKESEARRLGLITAAASHASEAFARKRTIARGLLDWAGLTPSATLQRQMRAGQKKNFGLVQSAEQLEDEARREALLRSRYHRALRARGLEGEVDDQYAAVEDEEQQAALEEEVDQRTWALSPSKNRHRQGSNRSPRRGIGGRYNSAFLSQRSNRLNLLDEETWNEQDVQYDDDVDAKGHDLVDRMTPSNSMTLTHRRRTSCSQHSTPSSGPGSKTNARRGRNRTDGGGLTMTVNQGLTTLSDVVAWASLVCVLIVAFFVSATRGEVSPRRILGSGERRRRRGGDGEGGEDWSREASEETDRSGDGGVAVDRTMQIVGVGVSAHKGKRRAT